MICRVTYRCFCSVVPAVGCDVGLDTDYGFNTGGDCLGVEFYHAEHIAVVGYGDRVHTEVFAPRKKIFEPYRAVEQRILAVQMKMCKTFVLRHRIILFQFVIDYYQLITDNCNG